MTTPDFNALAKAIMTGWWKRLYPNAEYKKQLSWPDEPRPGELNEESMADIAAALREQYAAGRLAGLEEAALAAEMEVACNEDCHVPEKCRDAIRALKGTS